MDRITLRAGRIIRISQLEQYGTYSGLLCGLPDPAMTARFTEDLLDAGRKMMSLGKPLLIEPELRHREVRNRHGDVRVEERLPPVACLACFESMELPNSEEPYSSLVVAWFQDRFGEPDAAILERIAAIDWDQRATAWCW